MTDTKLVEAVARSDATFDCWKAMLSARPKV